MNIVRTRFVIDYVFYDFFREIFIDSIFWLLTTTTDIYYFIKPIYQ